MQKFFEIRNDWNDHTLTSMGEWVNDGREHFETCEAAEQVIANHPDADRLRVKEVEYEIE